MANWRLWQTLSRLQQRGVLGANCRNACYILPTNPRQHFRCVDDKLVTKQICQARGILVPQTYAIVARHGDVKRLPERLDGYPEFVVKPSGGSRGRGIVVVQGRRSGDLLTSGGKLVSMVKLQDHVSSIISGFYSLNGMSDRAIVEQRIVTDPVFERLTVEGAPDIRIILYRGVPVMAMARLPTTASGGRANLHQGAVGVGVDLVTGKTYGGVWNGRALSLHPDTAEPIAGFQIPHWNRFLDTSMELSNHLPLDYVGIDLVLDARDGPVVLEANGRPGLAIQIANRIGLLDRLRVIDRLPDSLRRPDQRAELIALLAAT